MDFIIIIGVSNDIVPAGYDGFVHTITKSIIEPADNIIIGEVPDIIGTSSDYILCPTRSKGVVVPADGIII